MPDGTKPAAEGPTDPADAYWAAVEQGRLQFQRCRACAHAWLPPRSECPRCLRADWEWEDASGEAAVVSWVVYHVAYDESLRDRLPYNVAIVELSEGPRMITNLVGIANDAIGAGMKVRMVPERRGERTLACFTPA